MDPVFLSPTARPTTFIIHEGFVIVRRYFRNRQRVRLRAAAAAQLIGRRGSNPIRARATHIIQTQREAPAEVRHIKGRTTITYAICCSDDTEEVSVSTAVHCCAIADQPTVWHILASKKEDPACAHALCRVFAARTGFDFQAIG